MNVDHRAKVLVIGAGMAGSEAAYFLAQNGVEVFLIESKRIEKTPAQTTEAFGELVCTNSLKSMDANAPHGMLKYEMEALGSIILKNAKLAAVPAGDALAVDRVHFGDLMTKTLSEHPLITVKDQIVSDPLTLMSELNCDYAVVATGPLPHKALESWMQNVLAKEDLYFYDAIAPIVDGDSLDYTKLYYKDRHKPVPEEEGQVADYLNAPMNKEQYEAFIHELVQAEKVQAKEFEDWKFFEACLPIDLMAERGPETARFSCMKPIGLELPDGEIPYAAVQLRRENRLGSAFNLVGFQTRLKYPEQTRIFKMIPGLEEASFLHLGSVHRNTFLNAKKILNNNQSSREFPKVFFAGQMTGVEGYTESAASGLYVGTQILALIKGREPLQYPVETCMGALVNYIMTADKAVPSNINVGLLPPVELSKEERRMRKQIKKIKKTKVGKRARESFDLFYQDHLKELM